MRIALVNNTFQPFAVGGAEMSMLARAKGLKARGHTVKVFTLAADDVAAERNIGGVDVVYLPGRWAGASPFHTERSRVQKLLWHVGPEWVPNGRTDVSEAIAGFSPDVVNIANLPGLGYANIQAIGRRNIPVVMTVADFAPLCAGTTMLRNGKQCSARCGSCRVIGGPRLARFLAADQYIFISEFMRQRYISALPQHANRFEKAHVIHNGLDEAFIDADVPPPGVTERSSGDGEPLRIGYIGQLNPNKGVEALLACFTATKFRTRTTLTIAGRGDQPYEAKLKHMAGGHGDIRFLGWTNPLEFFQSVDMVVVPSIWNEPLGRVPYEANFFGRPALVANRGGLPELIECGTNGAVFDPEDQKAFQSCLLDWADHVSDRRPKIAQAARQIALDRHHPDRVAERYEAAFAL
ncbi:MAG: glycosyltransferase [Pseudomonadota bacterium]